MLDQQRDKCPERAWTAGKEQKLDHKPIEKWRGVKWMLDQQRDKCPERAWTAGKEQKLDHNRRVRASLCHRRDRGHSQPVGRVEDRGALGRRMWLCHKSAVCAIAAEMVGAELACEPPKDHGAFHEGPLPV